MLCVNCIHIILGVFVSESRICIAGLLKNNLECRAKQGMADCKAPLKTPCLFLGDAGKIWSMVAFLCS